MPPKADNGSRTVPHGIEDGARDDEIVRIELLHGRREEQGRRVVGNRNRGHQTGLSESPKAMKARWPPTSRVPAGNSFSTIGGPPDAVLQARRSCVTGAFQFACGNPAKRIKFKQAAHAALRRVIGGMIAEFESGQILAEDRPVEDVDHRLVGRRETVDIETLGRLSGGR